jgi:hypothetical protein
MGLGLFEAGGWTFRILSHYLMFTTRFDQTRMQNFGSQPFSFSCRIVVFLAILGSQALSLQPNSAGRLSSTIYRTCKIHGQPHKGRRACPSIQWIFIGYGEGILLSERAESDLQTQPVATATQNQGVILFTTQNKSLSEKYVWTGICKWAWCELEKTSQEWGSK